MVFHPFSPDDSQFPGGNLKAEKLLTERVLTLTTSKASVIYDADGTKYLSVLSIKA